MSGQIKTESFTFENTALQDDVSCGQQSPSEPQLSPLVKHIIRKSVLTRRKHRGAPELKVEFKQPVRYELTDEEKAKKERRRTQNRDAARRCRLKRRINGGRPEEDLSKLQAVNTGLQNDVESLTSEVRVLQIMLNQHQSSGTCVHRAHRSQQPEVAPYSVTVDQLPDVHTGSGSHSAMYGQCCSRMGPESAQTSACLLPSEEPSFTDVTDFFRDHHVSGTDPAPLMIDQSAKTQHSLQREPGSCGNDWLKQDDDVNRATPDIPHDDVMSLYPASTAKQEIGIPSLDCIDIGELLPGNIELSNWFLSSGALLP